MTREQENRLNTLWGWYRMKHPNVPDTPDLPVDKPEKQVNLVKQAFQEHPNTPKHLIPRFTQKDLEQAFKIGCKKNLSYDDKFVEFSKLFLPPKK